MGDNFKNGRKIARKEKEKEKNRKKRKKEKQNVAKLIGITITREMCLVILKKKKEKKVTLYEIMLFITEDLWFR